ncbi:hypothetical protein [Prosthecobacter fluviatilis]|uniref:Secreted protein n=1 Tax=Prosthecobacter fluviatilis TaxID=445931 RepID=A0ABW0KUY8_9BACT
MKFFTGLLAGIALALSPARAQVVEVLAPAWAYQLSPGMRLAELRTQAGRVYTRVKIEALDTQRIQFTHSQGRSIEFLVSIIDPTNPAAAGVGRRAPAGPLAAMMTNRERQVTGVDKLNESEQLVLKDYVERPSAIIPRWINSANNLSASEVQSLSAWLNQVRQARHPEVKPKVAAPAFQGPVHVPLDNWISGRTFTGFKQGRIFKLGNGQPWEQVDNKAAAFYPLANGGVLKVHIRAHGAIYIMSVEGAGDIVVKPAW